jgi:hypothetical protein
LLHALLAARLAVRGLRLGHHLPHELPQVGLGERWVDRLLLSRLLLALASLGAALVEQLHELPQQLVRHLLRVRDLALQLRGGDDCDDQVLAALRVPLAALEALREVQHVLAQAHAGAAARLQQVLGDERVEQRGEQGGREGGHVGARVQQEAGRREDAHGVQHDRRGRFAHGEP